MAQCKTCAHNLLGYCPIYEKMIPKDKIETLHECPQWRMKLETDVVAIVTGLIDTHPEHSEQWWTMRDMIEGVLHPPVQMKLAALHALWTAPYLDMQSRVTIAQHIIPF